MPHGFGQKTKISRNPTGFSHLQLATMLQDIIPYTADLDIFVPREGILAARFELSPKLEDGELLAVTSGSRRESWLLVGSATFC